MLFHVFEQVLRSSSSRVICYLHEPLELQCNIAQSIVKPEHATWQSATCTVPAAGIFRTLFQCGHVCVLT
jgi:hypothetical protein